MEHAITGPWPVQPPPPQTPAASPGTALPLDGESVLLRRLLGGDAHAFEAIVARYQRPVVGYLTGMLGDREEALDACQEVFVRILTKADRMDPDTCLKAWTYRVATNVAIDMLRRRRRLRWLSLDAPLPAHARRDGASNEAGAGPESADVGALRALLDRERTDVVRRAIATLPPRYRAVLALRDLQELSYEDIATVLRCSTGTVKSRVNRARTMLREKLAGYVLGEPRS